MGHRFIGLDHLRIFLIILVLLHHTAITYGAGGSWYFEDVDKSQMTVTTVILTIFTAVNQSFFMGLFFFLSGYFTPKSYDRKGGLSFLKDRLLRLGIPLIVYAYAIGPLVTYMVYFRNTHTYWNYYKQEVLNWGSIHIGPLWFVETLLYFNLIYFIMRKLGLHWPLQVRSFPTSRTLGVTALLLGITAFAVRFIYPTGASVLGMQFGYFPSYILFYIAGFIAYRSNWLERIPENLAKTWFRISLLSIPILPIGLVATGALDGQLSFEGGANLQAFIYAMWEPFVAIGICLMLLIRFKERYNKANALSLTMSNTAYTVYIIHPPIIVGISLMLQGVPLHPAIKFGIVGVTGIASCFFAAYLVCKIPYAKRILT